MSRLRLRFLRVPFMKSGLVSCSSYVLVWVRCFCCDFSAKFYFNHGYLSVKILVTLVAMVRLSIMSRKCLVEVCNSDSLVIEVVVIVLDSLLVRVLILGVVVWCVLWGKVEPLFRETLISQAINFVSSLFWGDGPAVYALVEVGRDGFYIFIIFGFKLFKGSVCCLLGDGATSINFYLIF